MRHKSVVEHRSANGLPVTHRVCALPHAKPTSHRRITKRIKPVAACWPGRRRRRPRLTASPCRPRVRRKIRVTAQTVHARVTSAISPLGEQLRKGMVALEQEKKYRFGPCKHVTNSPTRSQTLGPGATKLPRSAGFLRVCVHEQTHGVIGVCVD